MASNPEEAAMPRLGLASLIALLMLTVAGMSPARAHGEGAPQPVDTTGLEPLGEEYRTSNPYRGDARAIEIGARGYNSNCARCHGLDAKSGGLAPDLREVPVTDEMDGYFLSRVLSGAKRDDRVKMPPFDGLLSQEAIWAIRAYIDAQPE